MTHETVANHAEWHGKHKGNYIWYINGGELGGQYFRSHCPTLVDDYEGHLELWWWDE